MKSSIKVPVIINDFEAPEITEEDIEWICEVLGLPHNAFTGPDGNDPRGHILRSNESMDIAACPGSGKTTLLVAKLGILSRKWSYPTRGICVLSHTNAARHEIERGLGSTVEGRRLLSYPHFVGTIHGFVNQFLAMPWLRSLERPVRFVDDQLCEEHRRHLLLSFGKLREYVRHKEQHANLVSEWRVNTPDFDVVKRDGNPPIKDQGSPSARQLRKLVETCAADGYYCYDEIFVWANHFLDQVPQIRDVVRLRFPMLFIDEVQDNSERQSIVLSRLFVDGQSPVIRQRLGDSNQAIYQHALETEGAKTDPFPSPHQQKEIPDGFRFGQEIANLAAPLGLVHQKLLGHGPKNRAIATETKSKHAIFLFSEANIARVVPAFAEYLDETFRDEELRAPSFTATAVGGVHVPSQDGKKPPRSVSDYWVGYDWELSRSEPSPKTFFQYLTAGRSKAQLQKTARNVTENHYVVEAIAAGLLRLAAIAAPGTSLSINTRKHRQVLDLLKDNSDATNAYLETAVALSTDAVRTEDEWESKWTGRLCKVAAAIGGSATDLSRAKKFLESEIAKPLPPLSSAHQKGNAFAYPAQNPKFSIRLGSIHSVKGQTHTATLVLETFYYELQLQALKDWLLGKKAGGHGEKARDLSRLKQHYVAMTRPTHLLCLAMLEDSWSTEELANLKKRWRLARITSSGVEWL